MRIYGIGITVLLLTAGCAHEGSIRPAPTAQRLPEDAATVVAEANGVRLLANGSSWKSYPRDLEDHLTPVKIQLENRSGRPLTVQLHQFALVSEGRHEALSLAALDQVFSARATRVQGPEKNAGQRVPTTGLAIGGDSGSVDRTYTRTNGHNDAKYSGPPCISCMPPAHGLTEPSADMVRQAFTEGTLADGGTREGFLYFNALEAQERQVQLLATLVDANTGEAVATLSLPFEIR